MRVLDGVIRVEWSFHKKKKGRQTELLLYGGSAKGPVPIKVSRTPPFICIQQYIHTTTAA